MLRRLASTPTSDMNAALESCKVKVGKVDVNAAVRVED